MIVGNSKKGEALGASPFLLSAALPQVSVPLLGNPRQASIARWARRAHPWRLSVFSDSLAYGE